MDNLFNLQNAQSKINASYAYFDTDVDKAISLLSEAEKICPAAYNLYNTLGYAYQKKNDNFMVEKMFLQAIKLHPHSIQGYNDLANFYKNIGKDKEAKKIYANATKNVDDAENLWQNW